MGGTDAPITLYGRENSSGTYVLLQGQRARGPGLLAARQTLPGTAAVVNAVAKDPNGIGYGGAAYAKGVRDVAVKKDAGSAGVLPTRGDGQATAATRSRATSTSTRAASRRAT